MKEKRKLNWSEIAGILLFISLVFSVVYVIYRMIVSPTESDTVGEKIKSDYTLMLIQCILGIVVMFLPSILERQFSIVFPDNISIMYILFLYCAIYLGEVRSFYYLIPHWDSILHAFSGFMLCALGFSVINLLNKEKKVTLQLTPIFISLFALCFAVTAGVLWEVYEFTFDGILGLNMQKFCLEDGTLLNGRGALMDTMKDLIIDFASAFIMSAIGYVMLKKDEKWIMHFNIKRKSKEKENFVIQEIQCEDYGNEDDLLEEYKHMDFEEMTEMTLKK